MSRYEKYLVYANHNFVNELRYQSKVTEYIPSKGSNKAYQSGCKIFNLNRHSEEYDEVAQAFMDEWIIDYIDVWVTSVQKIQNPFLLGQYLLKKRKLEKSGACLIEQDVFHATRQSYVASICENNFNWRFHGCSRGHKFGRGVSFSPSSSFAHKFSRDDDGLRVMLRCKILAERVNHEPSALGDQNTQLPPRGFRTTTDQNATVVVLYEDPDFYPEYVIYYQTSE